MKPLRVTEEQVLYFRARRSHLVGNGAKEVQLAARKIIGGQAQRLAPSVMALSLRTNGRPTASEVKRQIFGPDRVLVRCWGQRDTVHLYDAASHWNHIVQAQLFGRPEGEAVRCQLRRRFKRRYASFSERKQNAM